MTTVSSILDGVRNRNYKLDKENFYEAKRVYLSLYRQAVYQLYMLGLQSDPHVYNPEEAREALLDEGYDLVTPGGKVSLSPTRLLYCFARDLHKDGESLFTEGTGLWLSVFDSRVWSGVTSGYRTPSLAGAVWLVEELRNQLLEFDKFYDDKKRLINRRGTTRRYTYSCSLLGGPGGKSDIFTEVLQGAIGGFTGGLLEITAYSTYTRVWGYLAKIYGIKEPQTQGTASLLVDGLSLSDEMVLLPYLLSGNVTLTTDFGKEISATLAEQGVSDVFYDLKKSHFSEYKQLIEDSLSEQEVPADKVLYFDGLKCLVGERSGYTCLTYNPIGYRLGFTESLPQSELYNGLGGDFIEYGLFTQSDGTPYKLSGVPLISSVSPDRGLFFDLELAICKGEVDDTVPSTFKELNDKHNPWVPLDESVIDLYDPDNLATAVVLAYNSVEAGYFGPVFYNASLQEFFPSAIKTFLGEGNG